MREFHYSEVSTMLLCSEKWNYQYRRGLSSPPSTRMQLGTVIHAGLEAGIKWHVPGTDNYRGAAISGGLEEAGNDGDLQDGAIIADRALQWLDLSKWETVIYKKEPLIERELSIRVPGGRYLFKPDWVARNRETDQTWLFDFKTRASLDTVTAAQMSLQFPMYQYALGKLGIPVLGSMEFSIRAELPKEPKVNKDGTVSRADCATDWETYKSVVLREGGNPDTYCDMEIKLKAKEWFRLLPNYRSQVEVQGVWDKVVLPTFRRIRAKDPKPIRVMQRFVCQGCSFLDQCLEELRGNTEYSATPLEIVE